MVTTTTTSHYKEDQDKRYFVLINQHRGYSSWFTEAAMKSMRMERDFVWKFGAPVYYTPDSAKKAEGSSIVDEPGEC